MLQFARDVLRQRQNSLAMSAYSRVAICAGCAEAKYKLTPEELEKEVAICAGCAEAKSEFEREETIGVP